MEAHATPRQAWYRGTYLRSRHWKAVRRWALARAGDRCEVFDRDAGDRCTATERLDVHHLTYAHLWHEWPSDVMVACRAHHEELEGRGTGRRSPGLVRRIWRALWS